MKLAGNGVIKHEESFCGAFNIIGYVVIIHTRNLRDLRRG